MTCSSALGLNFSKEGTESEPPLTFVIAPTVDIAIVQGPVTPTLLYVDPTRIPSRGIIPARLTLVSTARPNPNPLAGHFSAPPDMDVAPLIYNS